MIVGNTKHCDLKKVQCVINFFAHLNSSSPSNLLAASGIVEPSDVSPEELYDPREEFAEVSQHDQEERYAYDCVNYCRHAAVRRLWRYVAVT